MRLEEFDAVLDVKHTGISMCGFLQMRNKMYPATRMRRFPHGEAAREVCWTIKLSEQSSDNQLLRV